MFDRPVNQKPLSANLVFARYILDGCPWIAASVPNIRLCWVRWQVVEEEALENSALALQLDLFLLELSCDISRENFSRIIAAIKGAHQYLGVPAVAIPYLQHLRLFILILKTGKGHFTTCDP